MSGGSQVALEVGGALIGALVGAGVPGVIALLKFASAWGAMTERVENLEQYTTNVEARVRLVEQRGPHPIRGRG